MGTHRYKLEDGTRIPSVTTIIGRFKNSGGLLHWANEQGLQGKTLDEARMPAAQAGTLAHEMVECELRGQPFERPPGVDDRVMAHATAAFKVYLEWKNSSKINVLHSEVALVSEKHKFGGCLDAIGELDGRLVLIDWKTSAAVYADYLYQLAAYGILWDENYPDRAIDGGYHLCRFAKEQGDFGHHYYPSLHDEREVFLTMRNLYDQVRATERRVR